MSHGHVFWWIVVGACVAWYSTITVYIAVKGCFDIRDMLERLERDHEKNNASRAGGDSEGGSAST
jgi:hypothetical protein